DKRPPSRHVLKFYKDLPRRSCSIITQLRTGFIGLNSYLYKVKAVDSPKCPHCQVTESVTHFLLHCRRYIQQR
ncbi:hypothetical protein M422DRAFT_108546, partial [Sphaerobolus stellatus SS14]